MRKKLLHTTITFYLLWLLYYCYIFFVHPVLLNKINNAIFETGAQIYTSLKFLLNAAFYMITALIAGFGVKSRKTSKMIIVEVFLLDIPILFLATTYIQYHFLYAFFYTKNWEFYSEIGFLFLGFEILRYIDYKRNNKSIN